MKCELCGKGGARWKHFSEHWAGDVCDACEAELVFVILGKTIELKDQGRSNDTDNP